MENNDDAPWQYKPDGEEGDINDMASQDSEPAPATGRRAASFAWRSVEFVEHPHNPAWYGALALVTAGLTVLIYFVTRDYVATAMIPVVGIIVGVFASHKPGQVEYEISGAGLKVGGKNYPYSSFKSFSILQEGNLNSINLFPLKRFVPPIAAYFDPADQEKVIGAIGDHLPFQEHKMDGLDRLLRRLHL
jgi:hypothetical protein